MGGGVGDTTATADGHGVTADCGDPCKTEARKMAEALAESFLLATAARQELHVEKQKIRDAEGNLGTATTELAEARGQVARAQQVAEGFRDAAWRSEGLRAQAEAGRDSRCP